MASKVLRNTLHPGVVLQRYVIVRALARGSFGITYLADDQSLKRPVAIKEYFPLELAYRDDNATIQPTSSDESSAYQWGLDRFVSEARVLAKFDHRNIVRVLEIFEANNTAYIVMNYEEGEPLKDILARRKALPEYEINELLVPILDGLAQIHGKGFLHRDIKPANILIRSDGTPILLDFGSAREALSQRTRTFTALYSPGFAPVEQYAGPSGKQGPWTDIYGLAATLYAAIAGEAPAEAMQRSHGILNDQRDPYRPLQQLPGAARYSKTLLAAVDHALAFKAADRPQTIAAWRTELFDDEGETRIFSTEPLSHLQTRRDNRTSSPQPEPVTSNVAGHPTAKRHSTTLLAAATVALIGLLGGAVTYLLRSPIVPNPTEGVAAASKTKNAPATVAPTAIDAQVKPTIDHASEALARAEAAIQAGHLTGTENDSALAIYREILTQYPNHPGATAGLQGLQGRLEDLVRDAVNKGADQDALALLNNLKELGPLSSALRDTEAAITARAQVSAANQKAQQQQTARQDSIDQIRRALQQGQFDKAGALLDKVAGNSVGADPELTKLRMEVQKYRALSPILRQARVAMDQNKFDEVQSALDQAVKVAPKAPSVLALRKALEKKRSAATGMTESKSNPPAGDNSAVQKLLGVAMQAMQKSDWKKAHEAINKATELAPDSPDVQLMTGELETREHEAGAGSNVDVAVQNKQPGKKANTAPIAEPEIVTAGSPPPDAQKNQASSPPDDDSGVVVAVPKGGRRKPEGVAVDAQAKAPAVPAVIATNSSSEPAERLPVAVKDGVKIQTASTSVPAARPGQTIEFKTQYSLSLPETVKFELVEITWTLKQNGRPLGERGEFTGTEKSGMHSASTEFTIPDYMKPGKFAVEHKIDTAVGQDVAVTYFTVTK